MRLTREEVKEFDDTYPQYWKGEWDEEKAIAALCADWLSLEAALKRIAKGLPAWESAQIARAAVK